MTKSDSSCLFIRKSKAASLSGSFFNQILASDIDLLLNP